MVQYKMEEKFIEIRKCLKKKLKKERYEHTVGVMYTAAALAMRYEVDLDQAMTAGLLHDCGKYGTTQEQINRCQRAGISLTEIELQIPALIHAKLGAYLAEYEYKVKDSQILSAIRFHTTGRPSMSLLEKILYIADYIEPGRKEIPGLTKIRQTAFVDLDKAVSLAAKGSIDYLQLKGSPIDTMTIETYKYYKKGE